MAGLVLSVGCVSPARPLAFRIRDFGALRTGKWNDI
jgi:hypothetical protein